MQMHEPERTDAVANRARVMEAARQTFAERGLAVEMKDIAERACVGIGTIYRNFASKDDLINALAREAVASFGAITERAMRAADPADAIGEFLTEAFHLVDRYGWLMEQLLSGQLPQESAALLENLPAPQTLQSIVRRGVEQGAFRHDLDVDVAAAMLVGTIVPWNYGDLKAGRTAETAGRQILALFLRGALPRTHPE